MASALEDKEEIRDLIYAYARGVDRGDATQIQAVFHPDAKLDFGGFVGSPAEFAEMAVTNLAKLKSTHHDMTNILIKVDGDRASAETYAVAFHGGQEQADGGLVDFIAYVRYADSFERRDGAWKISERIVVQDAKTVAPHPAKLATTLPRELPQGQRDGRDPTYRLSVPIGSPEPARLKA